jgi:DNA topoisomerase-1
LVEKARWGRSVITKGKIKSNFLKLMLQIDIGRSEMIAKKTPAKKVAAKSTS